MAPSRLLVVLVLVALAGCRRTGEDPAVAAPARSPADAGTVHLAGVKPPGVDERVVRVTDSDCAARHHEGGETERECAIRCIHAGAHLVLVDRETGDVFTARAPAGRDVTSMLLPHVGYDVLVRGRVSSEDGGQGFEVADVFIAHDHTPEFGGAVGMGGDLHLEVLALASGEVRVYLSDRYRRAVPAEGVGGELVLSTPSGQRQLVLTPAADGRSLVARTDALPSQALEMTPRLKLGALVERYGVPRNGPDGSFQMTFLVVPQDDAAPPTRATIAR